jgi:hypothetical protein
MSEKIPKAEFSGVIEIKDLKIPCYVLEGGERIISTRGIMKSLGRTWRGRKYSGTQYPVFLEAKNLKPFISEELDAVLTPRIFKTDKGVVSEGFKAEVLPMVCETYLKAHDDGKVLTPSQILVAKKCDILVRAFAHIGIIALIDEATGYQEVRDRVALQKILDRFITDEWAKWTKTFPDEYYRELFKLKSMPYPPKSMKRPQYVGHWTNDIVYSRLAPGVLKKLKETNPRQPSGHRARTFHQYLTRDWGIHELREHLSNVIFLMKSCTKWEDFKRRLNRASPKYGDTMLLGYLEPDED